MIQSARLIDFLTYRFAQPREVYRYQTDSCFPFQSQQTGGAGTNRTLSVEARLSAKEGKQAEATATFRRTAMAFSGPVLGLVLLISFASAGNVLFGGMHASRSHVASMMPFALRLARENFSVHFMESYSGESYAYPPDVSPHLFKVPSNPVHKKQLTIAGWRRGFGPEVIGELFAIGDSAFLDMQRLHPKKMAQLLEKKWDLTVVDELFGISMYGIAAFHHNRSGTPYVVHSTTAILHVFAAKMGLGRPVFHRPSMWFPYNDNLRYDMSAFRMRLRSAVHALISAFCIDFLTQRFNVRGIKQIGVHHFDFHEAWTRLSYNFHDDLTNLAFPAPISNEIKYIGKYCPKANALSQEYREFLEDPRSKGTIFIAFGTNVDWAFAPKYVLDAFFDAIKQMTEYR
uniref:Glucuronosyltransferase n=1 Tax=Steinernema glaseri TaxID=37863 RepID=A0A1I7Z8U7_9BILA